MQTPNVSLSDLLWPVAKLRPDLGKKKNSWRRLWYVLAQWKCTWFEEINEYIWNLFWLTFLIFFYQEQVLDGSLEIEWEYLNPEFRRGKMAREDNMKTQIPHFYKGGELVLSRDNMQILWTQGGLAWKQRTTILGSGSSFLLNIWDLMKCGNISSARHLSQSLDELLLLFCKQISFMNILELEPDFFIFVRSSHRNKKWILESTLLFWYAVCIHLASSLFLIIWNKILLLASG